MLRNVITRIDLRGRTLSRRELLEELPRAEVDVEHAAEVVAPILAAVRARGAAELRDLARQQLAESHEVARTSGRSVTLKLRSAA